MQYEISSSSSFSEAATRAFLEVDAGQADTAVFSFPNAPGAPVGTVGGVWINGAFTWRAVPGRVDHIPEHGGTTLFAGRGDEGDAAQAARVMVERHAHLAASGWRIEV